VTTPCATLVASGHTGSFADSGYCYDGTWWYDTKSDFTRIRRWDFPAMSASHDVYVGASGDAEYPAIDFAGFLYCIDYRGTADVIVKVDLSTGPSFTHTDLASFTPANKHFGLVYHPTTGLLHLIRSVLSGSGSSQIRTQDFLTVDRSSGLWATAYTNIYHAITSPPGEVEAYEFEPTALTPDALWGHASTGSNAIWRLSVPGYSFSFGLDTVAPTNAGVGTNVNTLLVHQASPSQDDEVDSSFTATLRSCPAGLGSVGVQHSGWNFVAYQSSTNIYEIAAPAGGWRLGGIYKL
jgi:hypothetical protein